MAGRISPTVVALVLEGLRRSAPDALPPGVDVRSLGGDASGVPLGPYRRLLDDVATRAGRAAILRAGRALEEVVDPILFVLLNSDRIEVLIEKEARLARFLHSRHVVRLVDRGPRSVVLEHRSTVADPPRATESLASAGQHVVLLEGLGCRGLRLRLPRSPEPDLVVYDDGEVSEPAASGCHEWSFSWESFAPARRPMPGLDELLMANDSRRELAEVGERAAAVENVVLSDLGRTWPLAEVARRLATSPRSLQRALARESARFTEIVDAVRVREARRLLTTTRLSVTEIGYVCGFADTAHFSRRFKARIGLPPSSYREEERAGS